MGEDGSDQYIILHTEFCPARALVWMRRMFRERGKLSENVFGVVNSSSSMLLSYTYAEAQLNALHLTQI